MQGDIMVMMSDLNFVDGRIVLEVLYVGVRALGGSGDKVNKVNKVIKEDKLYLDKVYSQPNSMPLCKSELPVDRMYERGLDRVSLSPIE